eukprot:CAMPEP_0116577826 /NCGR_PEP_ID=MMETSP0397-20121206/21359_1 /TAXON_ID=216820 /ORGANISM="Cyclophora tenuis, Strain ECT3854" /LENGTH=176 /DNA_ID=CAMNT_0004107133 /DNA_START=173 /DNA_END=704 /DNA_ORIENTATION=+
MTWCFCRDQQLGGVNVGICVTVGIPVANDPTPVLGILLPTSRPVVVGIIVGLWLWSFVVAIGISVTGLRVVVEIVDGCIVGLDDVLSLEGDKELGWLLGGNVKGRILPGFSVGIPGANKEGEEELLGGEMGPVVGGRDDCVALGDCESNCDGISDGASDGLVDNHTLGCMLGAWEG